MRDAAGPRRAQQRARDAENREAGRLFCSSVREPGPGDGRARKGGSGRKESSMNAHQKQEALRRVASYFGPAGPGHPPLAANASGGDFGRSSGPAAGPRGQAQPPRYVQPAMAADHRARAPVRVRSDREIFARNARRAVKAHTRTVIRRVVSHPVMWITAVLVFLYGLSTASPAARQVIRAVWPV